MPLKDLKKLVKYKALELVKFHNFDVNFAFIWLRLKNYNFICAWDCFSQFNHPL